MSRRVSDLLVVLVFAACLASLSAQARSAPTAQSVPGSEAAADPAANNPGTESTEHDLLQSVQKTRDDVRNLRRDVQELRKLLESKAHANPTNPPAKASQIYRIMRTESGEGNQKVTTVYLMPVATEAHRLAVDEPPTKDEIMRSLPEEPETWFGGIFKVNSEGKKVAIAVEKMADTTGECRYYPLVGNARLKKRHYKCTVFFDKTTRSEGPLGFMNLHPTYSVVYIDHDHLIPCDGAASSPDGSSPNAASSKSDRH